MAGKDDDIDLKGFEQQQSKEEKKGIRRRMEDAPPPGMGPDGQLITVEEGATPWKPKVTDAEGNEVDLDD